MPQTNETGMNTGKVTCSILMPLPDHDFDPTESAIPFKVCASRGLKVSFSTEHGNVAQADPHKLKGPLPGLLSAGKRARAAYEQMTNDSAFQHPIPYADINPDIFQAILLPGGEAPGMRQYFESPVLRSKVLQFWQQGKLIGAICHGILILARTINPQTGRSILYGHKVTALPKSLDRTGHLLDSWFFKHGYIMYSRCVAEEVRACLEHPKDLSSGPSVLVPFPYVVTDGNLITSRHYGDAERFSKRFADELEHRMRAESGTPKI